MSRRTLVGAGVVIILLALGAVGYTKGWAGSIFADVQLDKWGAGGKASISTRAELDGGQYLGTEYRDGLVQLKLEEGQ
ncbi:MAG: hypothetical protein ACOYBJ_02585 [Patescibacteria group bacterium]|jgi:hypothetical protein